MKDIQLKKNNTGNGYDWNFNGLDLETVIGEQQVVNAVLHNILLRNNELEQEVYKDRGCSVYQHLPISNTSLSRNMLEEIIKTSVTEVEGVREAKITIDNNTTDLIINELIITLENGKEVQINGI